MIRRLLAIVALAASLASGAAAQTNQLPAIYGPQGYVTAQPTADVGYDSVSGAACVVGKTTTCLMPSSQPADSSVFSQSLTSATSATSFSTAGYGSVSFQVVANASANSIQIEGSNDGGTTWGQVYVRNVASSGTVSGQSTTTNTSGLFIVNGVYPLMRWKLSAFVGGTTTLAFGMKRQSSPSVMDIFQPLTGATTTNAASTIAVTSTFQSALAASTSRKGCRVTNKGTNIMRVFIGAPGSGATGTSFILAAGSASADGGTFDCGLMQGVVITDQISITGTAADAYLVTSQ